MVLFCPIRNVLVGGVSEEFPIYKYYTELLFLWRCGKDEPVLLVCFSCSLQFIWLAAFGVTKSPVAFMRKWKPDVFKPKLMSH